MGATASLTSSLNETLAGRARALGVFCWVRDRESGIEPLSGGGEPADRFFHAPQWRRAVESAVAQPDGHTHEPFPGCTMMRFVVAVGDREVDLVVAALTREFRNEEVAEAIGRSAALAKQELGQTLDRWACHTAQTIRYCSNALRWTIEDLARVSDDEIAIDLFSEELLQSYEQCQMMYKIVRLANGDRDPIEVIQVIGNQLCQVLPYSWVGFHFFDDTKALSVLQDRTVLCGEAGVSEALVHEMTRSLSSETVFDDWTKILKPGESALADLLGGEVILETIAHQGESIGIIFAGGKTGDDAEASSVEMQFLDATAEFIGVYHENISRFIEQKRMFLGTLRALTASIDAKDPYTRGHSERVALLGHMLALAAGLDEQAAERVRISGLVHDVGKIGVPGYVLCKNGRLTDHEYDLIKQHPAIGHKIIRDIPSMDDILPGVLYHHERYDGRGYPEGLAGEQIPLFGRILALADSFDAMSSNRAYRSALSREDVLAEIEECAGSQFDPELAKVFLKLELTEYDNMIAEHMRREREDQAA